MWPEVERLSIEHLTQASRLHNQSGYGTIEFMLVKLRNVWLSELPSNYFPSLVPRPWTRIVKTSIVLGRSRQKVLLTRTMNNEMSLVETDADAECARVAALSNE